MAWTYEELEERLRNYWIAANARGNGLLKVFFTIFGTDLLIMALLMTCVLPKTYAVASLMGTLVAFGLLAGYVLVTARAFHKANGVFCVHCGGSLRSLGDVLEEIEEDGLERPEALGCPRCHRIVVKNIA